MTLLIKTSAIVAGVLAVPVMGAAIIGTNYISPILLHLTDIIQGQNTTTVASLNAPNWSIGVPIAQVVGVTTATTSGQTLASSTPFTIAVAALDGTGTTTISASVTQATDASTTEGISISWGAVTGATGYAVYVATGTNQTNFSQYFLTTSPSYTLGTTTGSLPGSYTNVDTTAYSIKLNPLGASYLNGGNLGIGTTSPLAGVDIASSTIRASGAATSTCDAAHAGTMQYQSTSGHFYGCISGGVWKQLDN